MRQKLTLFLILIFLLTACTAPTATPANPDASPEPSATPQPTVGPTPTLGHPMALLILPADMDAQRSKQYQTAVYDLAQSVGYRYQLLNKLTVDDLAYESNLKVVIALPPDPGIAALAAAAPDTQFLTINIDGINPGGNVSVLGGNTQSIEKIAFMAGYIGAMITQDYRTGMILHKGSADAEKISSAMLVGQEFFCGLCQAAVPPLKEYPIRMDIPDDAKPNEYTAYADLLIRDRVDTMFLQPGMETPQLLDYLPTVGVLIIGTKSPTKLPGTWVVTWQANYLDALKKAWPDIVAGKGGVSFPAPLAFTDINPDLFPPGKQLLAQKILDDLLADRISTAASPTPKP